MRLSESEKQALKKPFGKLVPQGKVTKEKIINFVGNCKIVASVGDETTSLLVRFGIIPTISVTDGKTMRRTIKVSENRKYQSFIKYLKDEKITEFRCKNPPGTVSIDAYWIVIRAIQMGTRVKIIIDGEEDLLAIPLFAFLPKNSILAYGQPNEGLVLTRISSVIKSMAKDLLSRYDLTI